jgi:two-component system phosphate regulon response regulator PhoB
MLKKTILIVEDEKPLLEAIRSKLEKNDVNTFGAVSVGEAMAVMLNEKVDAVWLDHYLQGKENGLDFVAKIKSDDKFKNIPIFLVSNTATLDKVSSYIALGVNKYYTKSNYKLEQLVEDITNYIEL